MPKGVALTDAVAPPLADCKGVLEGAAGDAVGAKGDALPLREAGWVPVGARGEGETDGEPLADAL